ncbi:MAG TPA: ABC transporter substrate-binding protein [Burkholderiales bacterium]|jgi:branched-chain amino acid transport system substrate-binding protein
MNLSRSAARFAAFAGAAALALAAGAAQAQTPLKIGFIATLSGPAGALGQDQYDAFMMVVEANGGKLGGVPVQILKEDDQLKPDVGVQVLQKLIEKDKVSLFTGFTFSNVLMAQSKPLADAGAFAIVSNAGPAPLAGSQCNANFYFTSWQNDMQAEGMGKYATDQGYKKVYLLAPNYQAGKDSLAGFKRFYKGQVVDEVYTTLNQPDYSAEISQIAAKKPDAIYVFYPGGMGVNFIKQYKQSGLLGKIPLLSTSTADGSTLPALKDTALGVISSTFWGPDSPNPVSQKFVADFEKKFNRIPSQYAAQSYDAALLLDNAIGKVKGNLGDKNAFRAAIRKADFKSLRGPFTFNNNGYPIENIYTFVVAKDAKGRVNLKTIAQPLTAHRDAYSDKCPIK